MALERAGFLFQRQVGSHYIMRHPGTKRWASVPLHRTLKAGTLRGILNRAGLSVTEFIDLLNE